MKQEPDAFATPNESARKPPLAVDAAAALQRAVPLLTETLAAHWSTGQGTRVRHVLWSLYTCSHLVNLGDACSGLDVPLAEALGAAITARLVLGPEVEATLREVLRASGEFARYDEVEQSTPDHLPVVYPFPPAESRTLREMGDAMDHFARRHLQSAEYRQG